MPIAKKRPEKSASKKGKEKDTSSTAVAVKGDKDVSAGTDSKGEAESYADRLRREGVVATYALNSKKIHRNVRDISVTNLTVTFHGTPIIEEADLFLNYGNRYGYIGRNGCGKSTFMKVIAARCFPIPDGIDIFHLSEEIEATDMTAKEAVMSVDVERARLEAEAEELNDIVSNQEGSENAEEKKLVYYSGNYDSFVKTREEKEEEREKRYKAEQDQIKHMKDYVAKFGQGNAKMARQAQSKEKTLEKMLRGGLTEKVEHEKALDFKFPDPPKLSPPVWISAWIWTAEWPWWGPTGRASFTGGMVLVSHDMRLISQVAKEIWLCDKRTVTKYVGEISDFKIQLRRQMQMENLIDGDPNLQAYSGSSAVGLSQVVNNIVVAPPLPPSKAMTEEEKIQQARLELAEMAIAKQRARQAAQTSTGAGDVSKDKEVDTAVDGGEDSEEAKKAKEEEKAAAKAKRKAEKEAILLQEKREEEERIRRREEKLREQEEALKLKEQKRLEHEEFLKQKAVKEALKKAQEDAEAALLAEAAAKRRAEREERKRQKQLEKIAAQEKARVAAEAMVQADIWTQDQQIRFENALLEFTCAMDRRERWTKVAAAVGQGDGSKTVNQCIARYKYIKQYVLEKIHIELSSG
eukprot:gene30673-39951_t